MNRTETFKAMSSRNRILRLIEIGAKEVRGTITADDIADREAIQAIRFANGEMEAVVKEWERDPEWQEVRAWLAKQDIRYDSPHILSPEWYAENAADPMKMLRHLLCVVNTITAPHRHGNPIPKSRLDEMCEVQLRIEESIGDKI